jgi:hypothetical protein
MVRYNHATPQLGEMLAVANVRLVRLNLPIGA